MSPARSLRSFRRLALKAIFGKYLLRGETFRSLQRSTGEYCLDMDFESVPDLCERFDLTFPKI